MRLQVVAGIFKSRIQKKLLEQAWPQAEVLWGVPLEDAEPAVQDGTGSIVLVCAEDVDEGELRGWLEMHVLREPVCDVFLVYREGCPVPDWLPEANHVHVMHEPLDIHLMKSMLNEKAPSSAKE
jgi:hypothetical protein